MREILLLREPGAVRNADRKKHPSKNTLFIPLLGGQVSTPQNRTYQ